MLIIGLRVTLPLQVLVTQNCPLLYYLPTSKNNNKKAVTLSVCKALWGYLDQKCHRSAKCCYYSFVFNYTNSTVLCLLSDFSNKVKKSVNSEKVIQRPFNDVSPVSHYADRCSLSRHTPTGSWGLRVVRPSLLGCPLPHRGWDVTTEPKQGWAGRRQGSATGTIGRRR